MKKVSSNEEIVKLVMIIPPQSAFENDNYEAEHKIIYIIITVKVKNVGAPRWLGH